MGELIDDPFQAARLILTLRREGITDADVLRAVETVPRSAFIDPELADMTYEDCVLPIGCGQSLERPSVVASMLQAATLGAVSSGRLLIVGAGSGYMAGLATRLIGQVFTVERFRRLVDRAGRNLGDVGIDNVAIRHGDGLEGWTERAPFDRILLAGEVEAVPEVLFSQLADGGVCVAPIVTDGQSMLVSLDREGRRLTARPSVFHTPLRDGVSKAL